MNATMSHRAQTKEKITELLNRTLNHFRRVERVNPVKIVDTAAQKIPNYARRQTIREVLLILAMCIGSGVIGLCFCPCLWR